VPVSAELTGKPPPLSTLEVDARAMLVTWGRIRPLTVDEIARRAGCENGPPLEAAIQGLIRRGLACVKVAGRELRYAPLPGRAIELPPPSDLPDEPPPVPVFEVVRVGRDQKVRDPAAAVVGRFPDIEAAVREAERLDGGRPKGRGKVRHLVRRVFVDKGGDRCDKQPKPPTSDWRVSGKQRKRAGRAA
jgi:hypothetical protein